MKTQYINGLSSIYDKYDVFLFDIFGVLHDGEDPFLGTVDVIDKLGLAGKYVFFLTNAPHRSAFVIEQLKKLGIDESHYYGILTAGDQAHTYLRELSNSKHTRIGKTCYFIGTETMTDILPSHDYAITRDIHLADFILAAGPENPQSTVEQYQDVLASAAKQSIPMLCSNPDLHVFRKGKQEIRAGRLAALYQALGGKVCFYGKPYAETYDMACRILKDFKKERMLIIGDSLFTDIIGANQAHIDSLVSLSKMTLHEIGHPTDKIEFDRFCNLVQQLQNPECVPTYFTHSLQW